MAVIEDVDFDGVGFRYNTRNMRVESSLVREEKFWSEPDVKVSPVQNLTKKDFTVHLAFHNACNLSCGYCFRDKSCERHLDTEKGKSVVDRLLRKIPAENIKYFTLAITGEPFVDRKAFLSVYEHLLSKGFKDYQISFVTNGTLLAKTDIDMFRRHIYAVVSIDGPKYVHDRHRPMKDGESCYERTADAIRMLDGAGVHITSCTVLTKDDDISLWDIADHLFGIGCRGYIKMYPVKSLSYWTHEDVRKLLHRYEVFYKELERRVCGDRDFKWLGLIGNDIPQLEWHYQYMKCAVDFPSFMALDIDGNVYKCEYAIDGNPVCNIDDLNVPTWWEYYEEQLRKNSVPPESCRYCSYLRICGGRGTFCRYEDFGMRCGITLIKARYELRIYSWLRNRFGVDEIDFITGGKDRKIELIREQKDKIGLYENLVPWFFEYMKTHV